MTASIGQFINGHATPGQTQRTQPVTNPATGAVSGQVRLANAQDVHAAVAAAKHGNWSRCAISGDRRRRR